MALQELPIGGRQSLAADEKIPIEAAITAMNCYLDDDTIRGRNGYRNPLAGAVDAVNAPQGLWRFRPTDTIAATIVVIGGSVYKISSPSSETASDGTTTNLGTPFAVGDIVSGTVLGRYLYLVSNAQPNPVFVRVNPDFTLTTMTSLPKGVKPTVAFGSLSIVTLHGLTPALAGSAGFDVLDTDWHRMTDGAAGHCPAGGSLTYTLASPIVAADNTWLQVFATPPTQSSGNGKLKIEVATAVGSYESLGQLWDAPGGFGGGSPNVIWCNLNQLTAATQASIAKIRFTLLDQAGYAGIYGIMYIPAAPAAGSQQYNVTFKNSATGQRSTPTDPVTVTFASDQVIIPQYHSVYGNRDAFVDGGTVSASPDVVPAARNGNKGEALAQPDISVYAPVATFNGNIPTGSQYPKADTVELWRLTDTGWRIVKTVTLSSTLTTTYSITDDQGSGTSQHELYVAGGGPAPTEVTAAFAGRIVTGRLNRISCSSFEPFSALTGTDPYPQFPAIPTIDADGFAFDFAPSPRERLRALVGQESGADVLYILSNEAAYVMPDLSPNVEEGGAQSVPFRIYSRGAIGRAAWCFAENMLFWCARDGIYFCQNRVLCDELSKPIRRLVTDWFIPDTTTTLFYRRRKLYAVTGTRYIRYDFVTSRWSEGTLTDSPRFAKMWELDGDTGSETQISAYETVLNDTFDDTTGTLLKAHTPNLGDAWLAHPHTTGTNNWQVTSASTVNLTLNNWPEMVYNKTVLPSDLQISTHILYQDTANDDNTIHWRLSATDDTSYGLRFDSTAGSVKLVRRNAGAETLLASSTYLQFFGSATPTNAVFAVTITMRGLRMIVAANAVTKIDFTDSGGSAISTAGYLGLRATFSRPAGHMDFQELVVSSIYDTGIINTNSGTQTWLFNSNGKLQRWQEAATTDDGAAIPNWTYSTGYIFSPVRFTEDTIYTDATGTVTVNTYKSADTSVTRSLTLASGEREQSGWPDFLAYKTRLQFTAANAVQLRRFAWNIAGEDGVGT